MIRFQRFVLSIRWKSPTDAAAKGQFILGFAEVDSPSPTPTEPSKRVRNPHRRMVTFLQEMLNKSRNVKSLVGNLVQTLPMLLLLDEMETRSIASDGVGRISIIPRKIDHWRIVWTEKMWAVDVSFVSN